MLSRVWGVFRLYRMICMVDESRMLLSFEVFQSISQPLKDSKHTLVQVALLQPAAMVQKTLQVTSPNGDQRMVSVLDTTTVKEIMQQCHEDGVQDRQATLIRGMTLLEPDMTVSEAGLEDEDGIALVWSEPFVEMARWEGEEMGKDLYVRITPGRTSIDEQAFRGCKALVKLEIPNSVTSIGSCAFNCCSSLTEVEIPNSVTRFQDRTFQGCSSLTQVKIPNSVTSIGNCAFRGCSSLRQVEIPNSVTSIGIEAFSGCSSLTHVEIPASVTFIGRGAFAQCSSLTQVELPDSVTSIGAEAFSFCNSVRQVERVLDPGENSQLGPEVRT